MRFVTSGVGGLITGAGFVARGGVEGRSMTGLTIAKCHETGWRVDDEFQGTAVRFSESFTADCKLEKKECRRKIRVSRYSGMTAICGGGAGLSRSRNPNYVTS